MQKAVAAGGAKHVNGGRQMHTRQMNSLLGGMHILLFYMPLSVGNLLCYRRRRFVLWLISLTQFAAFL